MFKAIEPLELRISKYELVRLWAHEGLRLFHDRLMSDDERAWCHSCIDEVAASHFQGVNIDSDGVDTGSMPHFEQPLPVQRSTMVAMQSSVLRRPLLYSTWLRGRYLPVEREELRFYLAQRLAVFCEEELDVNLVLFDDVLEHVPALRP